MPRKDFGVVRDKFARDNGLPFGRLLSREFVLSALEGEGHKYRSRVFCPAELAYAAGKSREVEHLAGRFAAKEAVLKALGTEGSIAVQVHGGQNWPAGAKCRWKNIKVRPLG